MFNLFSLQSVLKRAGEVGVFLYIRVHFVFDFFFFFLPSLLIFSLCFRISRTNV